MAGVKTFLTSRDLTALRRAVDLLPKAKHPAVHAARQELFQKAFQTSLATLEKADFLFCNAPTGSGKTIALATLAARLAKSLGLSRIVIVLPFLVTCRQSTIAIRSLLAEAGVAVAEDTSGVPPDEDSAEEAWESGIVVTSAVAFTEALSSSSGRGRERWSLLEDAVVILDDCCQWITPVLSAFVILRLQALRDAGGRIIFSSATLPKYWQMAEIRKLLTRVPVVKTFELTERVTTNLSKRVKVSRLERSLNFGAIAEFALGHRELGSGLIVVNTIATALRLYAVLHIQLSRQFLVIPITSRLCRRDKRDSEERVREMLITKGKRILVIATSCIEAGWDVSFAWAMREQAWLSNLLQVAGRVNRHGESPADSPVWSFQISDPLAQSNPELRDQIMCFETLHKGLGKIGPNTVTEATEKLITEFSPRLIADARRLVAAWRLGDRESIEKYSRLIRQNRSTCFVPFSRLPEELQKRLADKSGLLIDSRTFDALYPYQIDVDSRLFKETPWKFDVKILNGRSYYFLSPEHYDASQGGLTPSPVSPSEG